MTLDFDILKFQPLHDPAFGEIVRTHLDRHAISRQQTDIVYPDLPRYVSENLMPIIEPNPKSRSWKSFCYLPVHTDHVFSISHIFFALCSFQERRFSNKTKTKVSIFFRSEPTLIPELQRVAPLALNLCDFSKCIDYCSKSQSFVNRGPEKLPTNRISVPVPDIPLWPQKTPLDRNPGTISPKRKVGNWLYPTS